MKKLFFQAGLSSEKVSPPVEDFRRAVAAIRSYDLIIATRFHATVVANAFGIPNLAVASGDYYLAKMQAATSGYETASRLVNPADFAPGALLDLCRQKLSGHHGRGVPVVEPDNSAASPTLPKDEPRKTFGA